ncbi:alpha-amylase family glycosyl hydrolase [Zeaxanthinibacter sp. PT1]|uniref:alpha-amylase family glycosyl hydrolase n=1 Tax=Zeaxanthinibacter TaxID=561554 RepID=UPI00234A19CD|nr:alpha-amylase family glycosyl hydrolase [Zeaxanthinibacter sp. PT1]MDC6352026.1 alpha-amylase family glycosyl hydrolase [Zeaxanthinibacter sp. PT1]
MSTYAKPRVPDWHKNATLYEVNLRHYTPEGTIKAFSAHLPRLKQMGVDILWFMPLHPVSKKKRKGELGSPYAAAHYTHINPLFGTDRDFRNLLQQVRLLGMHTIIDWIPNHTGWDHPWITDHPDWYLQDDHGNIIDPVNPYSGESWGWTDVAALNYSSREMRNAMIAAMRYWVEEVGVDGFRVDVAHGVPFDFWEECTDVLYAIKPLFMLAEAEVPELLNSGCFVMDYGWDMHKLLRRIAKYKGATRREGPQLVQGNLQQSEAESINRETHACDIDKLLAVRDSRYHRGYQMYFTSNHDENAWSGTAYEWFGEGHEAFAVLTATFSGMPLLYSGMESAIDKQFRFFTKDEIDWGDFRHAAFYEALFKLKHRNKALWNGSHGGKLVKIITGQDRDIYAFSREKEGDRVVVLINLSSHHHTIHLDLHLEEGPYYSLFTGDKADFRREQTFLLVPWDYRVFSNR